MRERKSYVTSQSNRHDYCRYPRLPFGATFYFFPSTFTIVATSQDVVEQTNTKRFKFLINRRLSRHRCSILNKRKSSGEMPIRLSFVPDFLCFFRVAAAIDYNLDEDEIPTRDIRRIVHRNRSNHSENGCFLCKLRCFG